MSDIIHESLKSDLPVTQTSPIQTIKRVIQKARQDVFPELVMGFLGLEVGSYVGAKFTASSTGEVLGAFYGIILGMILHRAHSHIQRMGQETLPNGAKTIFSLLFYPAITFLIMSIAKNRLVHLGFDPVVGYIIGFLPGIIIADTLVQYFVAPVLWGAVLLIAGSWLPGILDLLHPQKKILSDFWELKDIAIPHFFLAGVFFYYFSQLVYWMRFPKTQKLDKQESVRQ